MDIKNHGEVKNKKITIILGLNSTEKEMLGKMMIEWIIMAAFFVYVLFSIIVVLIVAFRAKKKGRSALKWGIGAALVMYHLVFWDLIPTWVVYKYYCATKAGFWVYKTPEQWKAENPGVAETLTWREMSSDYKPPGVADGLRLNERIAWIRIVRDHLFLPVSFTEHLIIDVKNNEVLVKRVAVGAGNVGTEFTRFWTHLESYMPNNNEFGTYESNFKKLGTKKND